MVLSHVCQYCGRQYATSCHTEGNVAVDELGKPFASHGICPQCDAISRALDDAEDTMTERIDRNFVPMALTVIELVRKCWHIQIAKLKGAAEPQADRPSADNANTNGADCTTTPAAATSDQPAPAIPDDGHDEDSPTPQPAPNQSPVVEPSGGGASTKK